MKEETRNSSMMSLVKHRPDCKFKVWFGLFLSLIIIVSTLFWSTNIKQNQTQAAGPDDFVTTWNSGSDGVVKIPILKVTTYNNATSYNFTVDWGDGSPLESFTGNATLPTHTYASLNTEYDIRINGVFAGWSFHTSQANITAAEATALPAKITKLKQWGTFAWKSVSYMFNGAKNMVSEATDIPNTSAVTSFGNMFTGAEKFDAPILFDTSNGTNFAGMFMNAKSFNSSVSNMNTAKAVSMSAMFYNAAKFNQSVSNFDTSKVTNAALMFAGASAFNQPVPFNTSNMMNMSSMFSGAASFNQPLTSFNTSKTVEMSSMFSGATSFNQPLTNFDTSRVGNMAGMFYRATAFNQPLNNFNTANVTNMTNMFAGATSFNQSLAGFNAERVVNMGRMLEGATSFNSPLPYNTGNVTNMLGMLARATSFNQSVSGLDTSKVQTFASMFSGATNFNQPVPFNTSSATNMRGMFQNTSRFNQSLASFDTSKVINMSNMFQGATAFNQPVNFNTQKVNNMAGMFSGTRVFNQPINFNTSNVTNFASMFQTARAFDQDLSHLNFSNATSFSNFMQQALSFSVKNYDKLLIAWEDQLLGNGKTYTNVYMQPIKYCVGEGARTRLRANGWSIYDSNVRDCTSYGVDSIVFAGQTAVDENTAAGTELGSLTANSQIPGDTFSYSLTCNVAGAQDGFVTLSGNRLSLAQVPNYEQNQTLNICVRATNSVGTTRDQNFTFTVRDVNEAPTIGGVPTNSVNQDQNYSFTPTAGDPDTTAPNNALTFAIANKPSWANFNSATGALTGTPTNAEVGNYENIVIRVTDGGGLTAALPAFNITVNNINDTPVITDQAFSVAENSANGTVVGQVTASDIDAGQNLSYEIVGGNSLGMFALSANGQLTVADNNRLDFEDVVQVVLRVRVSDNGTPAMNAEADVTVNITDVNEAPVWTSGDNITLKHNESKILDLSATDPENQALTYVVEGLPGWITFDSAQHRLLISPTSIALVGNYSLTAKVNDGVNETTQTITVRVIETNVAPVINNQNFSVAENSVNGTVIGQVGASDENTGDVLNYEIVSGNDLGIFALSAGGQLTVADSTNLDYEQHGNVVLTVRVSDNSSPILSDEAEITINITDVNEAPSISGAPATSVNQGEAYSFTPTATDPDTTAPNNTLTFSIDNKPSWLNFDANTGVLTGTPTNEHVGAYESISIRVSDGAGLTATLPSFGITVNNVNDVPVITDQAFNVAENSANGTVVGQVTASDIDAGQNLSYEIVSGNSLGMFALSANGQLTVADNSRLDAEDVVQVVLRVRVSDNGTPAMSAEADVTINVTDVNEAPSFTSNATVSLAHNEVLTHDLSATDPENATLTYSATGLPAWMNLAGNSLTLTPTVAQIGEHDVIVKVSDGVNEASQTIHVTVREANIAPVMTDQTFSIDENSINGTLVGTLAATDTNTNDNLNFTIIGGNELGIFNLGSDGKLTIANNTNLDYEARQSVTLRVRVSDNGTPVMNAEANVVININDIDDEAPIITIEGGTAPREIMVGETFTAPAATCHDNQGNCTLTIANPVDSAVAGSYTLVYKAVDEAGNQTIVNLPVTVKPTQTPNQGGQTGNQGNQGQNNNNTNNTGTASNSGNTNNSGSTTNGTTDDGSQTIPADDDKPPFVINGVAEMELELGQAYVEPGVTCATGTSCSVEIVGKVDTSVPGTYTITYKSTDANGKVTTVTRKVTVRGANDKTGADSNTKKSFSETVKEIFVKYLFWWWWPIIPITVYYIYRRWKAYRKENPFIESKRPRF